MTKFKFGCSMNSNKTLKTMAKEKVGKLFVLDTNVALHDSSCIYKFQENDIHIPIQVIEELDNFKKGYDTVNFHAREICRELDRLSGDHIFNGGVSLGPGLGKLSIDLPVELNPKVKNNLRVINTDAEIINLAIYLQETNKSREVVLVSKDVNLRMKAKALGVLAQDYLAEAVININFLDEKVQELQVEAKFIDQLYKNGSPICFSIENARQNQNYILKNSAQSALVQYRNDTVRKITKDKLWAFNTKPKNSEQAFGMDALLDPTIDLVTIEGKAGTGKNIITLACALEQLGAGKYGEVFFSRQTISMGNREIGFLPGDIDEKIGPFMKGMNDNLAVLTSNEKNKAKVDQYLVNKKLIIEPLPYIRGRSLHNVFFIIDEAQNLTPHEVKTIATRAGEGTKLVFIGDTKQIDHPYLDQKSNGFSYLIQKFWGQSCHAHIHLVKSERSKFAELAGEIL